MVTKLHTLLHICSADEWLTARGESEYRPSSLATQGFIHLSTPQQVHLPANRIFAGRTDLVLLHVDPQRLHAPVRWEAGVESDPADSKFPHLYGPLPTAAVTAVVNYLPDTDGRFAPLPG